MNNDDFCTCSRSEGITSGYEDDWGFWDIFVSCGRK